MLNKRQKQAHVVDHIGDIFLDMVPHFAPFVKYGAHQLYGKYEFEKEKGSNPAFAKFVDVRPASSHARTTICRSPRLLLQETERLPESRKLELNGYLTKPTTRLARYPLLLEACLKHTADDNPDKVAIPKVIKLVREFLGKVNVESGKSENRFNLAQLDQQLVFKNGEAVVRTLSLSSSLARSKRSMLLLQDLRLRDEERELIFKGPLKKRGGTQSDSAELQVFLFDHAVLMVKQKSKNEQYKVYRKVCLFPAASFSSRHSLTLHSKYSPSPWNSSSLRPSTTLPSPAAVLSGQNRSWPAGPPPARRSPPRQRTSLRPASTRTTSRASR